MTLLSSLVRVLIRTTGLTAFLLLYLYGANVGWWGFENDGGLGTGLLGFALLLLLAGLWGLVDGTRHGLGAAIVWVAVAVLSGITMTIGSNLVNGAPGADVASELLVLAPVFGCLVLAGGAVGALVGGVVHLITRRSPRPVAG